MTDTQSFSNKDKLDALFEASNEGIIISNRQGMMVMLNPAASKLFGYEPDELLGQEIEVLIPIRFQGGHHQNREDFHKAPRARVMGIGRDLFAKKKDGTEFPVEVSLSYFVQDGERFVISFIIDITARKISENALKEAKNKLEKYADELSHSNKELEQFAYVASHDLQEPLRKIQAFGDRLIIKEGNKLSEEGLDYLNRMKNAAARMQGLINDLLAFSRVTSQAKPFVYINLSKLVVEVLSDLEIAIEKSGAEIFIDELPAIEADPLQLRQLFQNLLSNAIKFRKEGVKPIIYIRHEILEPNPRTIKSFIKLYIEDNGIGFDEKYLDKIFTIFQRVAGKDYAGSGVGLAICKKIALRHGGDITAKSQPDKGTVFIVTLPLQQPLNESF